MFNHKPNNTNPSPLSRIRLTFKHVLSKTLPILAVAAALTLTPTPPSHAQENPATPEKPTSEKSAPIKLVALGDSLTAGYQLPPGTGFPEQLGAKLLEKGYNVIVNNAGVSGDTTSGGRARLDWALEEDTDAVILELGPNDALRGIDPALTRQNLEAIILEMHKRGIKVLLAGALAPPNMGPDYAAAFNPIYPELATKHGILLYPFFLDGVAAQPKLNLADGMHPTAEGVGVIVEAILPRVEELIDEVRRARTAKTDQSGLSPASATH
ncbi:MAG: acyl-CoA thioesterase-1 [Parvibaculaceae bacterium]|jgi:acyl-CoA thioesterase-1